MDYEQRGGRGDRTGRYGNSSNNHNFRDMDYRGYEQEDEETETHGFYACDDRPSDVPDFRERPAFPLRGDGPQEPGDVDKCGPWPPCHQPQPATASRPFPLRMERPPRFEHPVRTGLLERPRGKDVRGFTESTAPVPGNRDGNWGATGSHSDGTEFHPARLQDEDRFSRDTAKRRSFSVGTEERCMSAGPELSLEELDQKDQDYRADLEHNQRPSNIIMLRMLPPNATANEIRAQLQEQGIQPREVRLMRNKSSGQSRGFAFVEFNVIQEATRWMETNQGVLLILGQRVSMHYSDPKPRANEDWLCNKCGVQNFKRRDKCFKCSVPKSEAELKLPQLQRDLPVGLQKEGAQGLLPLPPLYHSSGPTVSPSQVAPQSDVANDTLILRNLGPHTSLESILSALAPFATLSPSNIRLIKDKHTQLNRGFAFLQLSTIVEASQLLQILQALQPALSIDGKTIAVEFAKGSKRDVFQTDSNRVSAATVASTAIAAAQWAVTQNGPARGMSADTAVCQQAAAVSYGQEGTMYSVMDGALKSPTDPKIAALPAAGVALMGTYTGGAAPAAISSPSGSAGGQLLLAHTQAALLTAATATPVTQVEIVGKPQPAAPSQPATPGTEQELKHYPVPDVSTYHYDESSGYYYDPHTGLYYDASSQYYYNPHTQQYMYWDGENHTYTPAATEQASAAGAPLSSAPSDSLMTSPGNKEKKDKPKSKTAQQIAKDMERWAKSLNRQKENMRSVSSSSAVSSAPPPGYVKALGHGHDRRESASADAGYAVLEKKGALSERPQMFLDQIRQSAEYSPPEQQGLVPAYSGETDSEEEAADKEEREGRMTDWVKLACLLCRRQFPSKEALIRHQQLSELHKQNLEQRRIQQEVASRERLADGTEAPDSKRRKLSPIDGVTGTSLGARMLQGGVKKGLLLRNMQVE